MPLKGYTPEELDLWVKFVLYGPEGYGKTTWLAQHAPEPVVWLDFEQSSDAIIAGRQKGIIDPNRDITIYPVKPKSDIQEVRNFCMNFARHPAKTLIFDTISTSQTYQLDSWMAKNQNKDGMPLWKDYRKSTTIFNEIFLHLQHTPKNVILVAHEKDYYETVNDANGEHKKYIYTGPQVTPALAESVRQMISGVIRLQKKTLSGQTKRTMLMNEKDKFKAKNRYGVSEIEVDNPTWDLFRNGVLENA